MNRLTIMKIHALLAAFILPVAVMFAVTGSLYTWGIKGGYSDEVHTINLSAPLTADTAALTKIVKTEISTLDISAPEGKPKIKKIGKQFRLEWTGSSKDILLEAGDNASTATMTIKHTSWYRNLVQLHKAKGGSAFKVYAVVFAIALGLLLISGFIMALQTPKLKAATLTSTLVGLLSFIVFVIVS